MMVRQKLAFFTICIHCCCLLVASQTDSSTVTTTPKSVSDGPDVKSNTTSVDKQSSKHNENDQIVQMRNRRSNSPLQDSQTFNGESTLGSAFRFSDQIMNNLLDSQAPSYARSHFFLHLLRPLDRRTTRYNAWDDHSVMHFGKRSVITENTGPENQNNLEIVEHNLQNEFPNHSKMLVENQIANGGSSDIIGKDINKINDFNGEKLSKIPNNNLLSSAQSIKQFMQSKAESDRNKKSEDPWHNMMSFGKKSDPAWDHNTLHFGKRDDEMWNSMMSFGKKSGDYWDHNTMHFGKRDSDPWHSMMSFGKKSENSTSNVDRGKKDDDPWHSMMSFGKKSENPWDDHSTLHFGKKDDPWHSMMSFGKRSENPWDDHSTLHFGKKDEPWHSMMSFGKRSEDPWGEHSTLHFGKREDPWHSMMSFGKRAENPWDDHSTLHFGKKDDPWHSMMSFGKRSENPWDDHSTLHFGKKDDPWHSMMSFGKKSENPWDDHSTLHFGKKDDPWHNMMSFGKKSENPWDDHSTLHFGKKDEPWHSKMSFGKRSENPWDDHSTLHFGKKDEPWHSMMSFGKKSENPWDDHSTLHFGKKDDPWHSMMSFGKKSQNPWDDHSTLHFGKRDDPWHSMMSFGKRSSPFETAMEMNKNLGKSSEHTTMQFGEKEDQQHNNMNFETPTNSLDPHFDDTLKENSSALHLKEALPVLKATYLDKISVNPLFNKYQKSKDAYDSHNMLHLEKKLDSRETHNTMHFGKKSDPWDTHNTMHFGKKSDPWDAHNTMHFGKKSDPWDTHNTMHFGKKSDPWDAHNTMHFGKKSDPWDAHNTMHFGKKSDPWDAHNTMHFGKKFDPWDAHNTMHFGKKSDPWDSHNTMHFGKRADPWDAHNTMHFGKRSDLWDTHNTMHFGKREDGNANKAITLGKQNSTSAKQADGESVAPKIEKSNSENILKLQPTLKLQKRSALEPSSSNKKDPENFSSKHKLNSKSEEKTDRSIAASENYNEKHTKNYQSTRGNPLQLKNNYHKNGKLKKHFRLRNGSESLKLPQVGSKKQAQKNAKDVLFAKTKATVSSSVSDTDSSKKHDGEKNLIERKKDKTFGENVVKRFVRSTLSESNMEESGFDDVSNGDEIKTEEIPETVLHFGKRSLDYDSEGSSEENEDPIYSPPNLEFSKSFSDPGESHNSLYIGKKSDAWDNHYTLHFGKKSDFLRPHDTMHFGKKSYPWDLHSTMHFGKKFDPWEAHNTLHFGKKSYPFEAHGTMHFGKRLDPWETHSTLHFGKRFGQQYHDVMHFGKRSQEKTRAAYYFGTLLPETKNNRDILDESGKLFEKNKVKNVLRLLVELQEHALDLKQYGVSRDKYFVFEDILKTVLMKLKNILGNSASFPETDTESKIMYQYLKSLSDAKSGEEIAYLLKNDRNDYVDARESNTLEKFHFYKDPDAEMDALNRILKAIYRVLMETGDPFDVPFDLQEDSQIDTKRASPVIGGDTQLYFNHLFERIPEVKRFWAPFQGPKSMVYPHAWLASQIRRSSVFPRVEDIGKTFETRMAEKKEDPVNSFMHFGRR